MPSSPPRLYEYKPLLPGLGSIRLLRVLPSQSDDAVVQCQLLNCSLQKSNTQADPYDALSYVWGNQDETCPIGIDGSDLLVTLNLYRALMQLRHRYIERIMWVDSVCIDQANTIEKEQQILLMAKIYSQATRVIVWLGVAADHSDEAINGIGHAGGKRSTDFLITEAIEKAVLALLQRPWFRRIWVRQLILITISGTNLNNILDYSRSCRSTTSHYNMRSVRNRWIRLLLRCGFVEQIQQDMPTCRLTEYDLFGVLPNEGSNVQVQRIG